MSKRKAAVTAAQQPARTAEPRKSIWNQISENAFRQTVVALARATKEVPHDPDLIPVPQGPSTKGDDSQRRVPWELENRLANDFAYIAASEEGVGSVSAACVEEDGDDEHSSALTIRVAANEGVKPDVRCALRNICDVMERCAAGDVSTRNSQDEIFRLIIQLDRGRICARMRMILDFAPSFCSSSQSRGPYDRLSKVFLRMRQQATNSSAQRLVDQLKDLTERFVRTNLDCDAQDVHQAADLEDLVKSCYNVTTDTGRCPFRETLIQAGLDAQEWLKNKYVMQIDKIGAYWRIAKSFARESGRPGNRSFFSRLRLEYESSYIPVRSAISFTNKSGFCYVHAEVQLITHYLLLGPNPRLPRVIGASKSACFLCHLFISCWGLVTPPPTHGRLYDLWTIPDVKEYSPKTVDDLRTIIRRMRFRLSLLTATKAEYRPYPLTSRHNIDRLPTPSSGLPASSVSTIKATQEVVETPNETELATSQGVAARSVSEEILSPSASTDPPSDTTTSLPLQISEQGEVDISTSSNVKRVPSSSPKVREPSEPGSPRPHSPSAAGGCRWKAVADLPSWFQAAGESKVEFVVEVEKPSSAKARLLDLSSIDIVRGWVQICLEDLEISKDMLVEKAVGEDSLKLCLRDRNGEGCGLELKWR